MVKEESFTIFFCFSGYKSRGESVIPSFYTFAYHKQNNIFKSSFTETEYRPFPNNHVLGYSKEPL